MEAQRGNYRRERERVEPELNASIAAAPVRLVCVPSRNRRSKRRRRSIEPELKTPLGGLSRASVRSGARQLCKSAFVRAPLKKTIRALSGRTGPFGLHTHTTTQLHTDSHTLRIRLL